MNLFVRALSTIPATILLTMGATAVVATPAVASPADEVQVIAHRGSSGAAPENTLAAVELALAHSSDVVENDIHRTADGEFVVIHDTTLGRTTDVEQVFPNRAPWNVRDFSLAEIKRLDAGSWFAPEFAGERVPTLAEWAHGVGNKAGMLLEAKSPELYPAIEVDLDKELRSIPEFNRALRRGEVVVQSFNHAWLKSYKDRAPDVPVGLLFGGRPSPAELELAAQWAEQVNPALAAIDEDTVDKVHAEGLEISVWTVNGGADMRRAADWGVDGIITNYPQVLRDILRRR